MGLRGAPVHAARRLFQCLSDGVVEDLAQHLALDHEGTGGVCVLAAGCREMMSRSVRPRPRPYSRSMRPSPLAMRCRNACNRSCGRASAQSKRPM